MNNVRPTVTLDRKGGLQTLYRQDRKVDVVFPVSGRFIPRDHGYRLFSAVSDPLPFVHMDKLAQMADWVADDDFATQNRKRHKNECGIFPIRGKAVSGPNGEPLIELEEKSVLRLRVPKIFVKDVLNIGNRINIVETDEFGDERASYPLKLGTGTMRNIGPSENLRADLVLIRLPLETGETVNPENFMGMVNQQLDELGVTAQASIPSVQSLNSRFIGEPIRKVFEIKGFRLVGYPLELRGLNAADSVTVQENGIGGKRAMGCGCFYPFKPITDF